MASSAALVCPHCRYSVVRTDRDLRAVGRVADLVPTSPALMVGDSGMAAGDGFRVAGRMQLDHGRGPWDEWYVAFDDGSWGWLAQAQGQWYLTKPTAQAAFPAYEHMRPGQQGALPPTGDTVWTVSEQGVSTVVSAEGELPFAVVSGETGRYVDLVAPNGAFATLDYGAGHAPPQLFAGRALAHGELDVAHTAAGPRVQQQVSVDKLSCPSCGAPVPIVAPDAERAACAYCYALLDLGQGKLRMLEQLSQPRLEPLIPLGAEGTLDGEKLVVIGFMERFTVVWGVTYAWREYLLYGERGYRWLLESDAHWSFLAPISAADVERHGKGVRFRGRTYKHFQANSATVRFVIGEFYWKVRVGESAHATEFIAPPRTLSQESTDTEITFSEGRHVEPREVWNAFGLSGSPPKPMGIAPAQRNPHSIRFSLITMAVLMVAFVALSMAFTWTDDQRVLVEGPLQLPATPARATDPTPTQDRASYTPTFTVTEGPTTLEIDLTTTANNNWIGVACALINERTGEIREFFVSAEYYSGFSGGQAWSEGSRSAEVFVDQVEAGEYTLRLDPQWNAWSKFGPPRNPPPPTANLKVTQGTGNGCCCLFAAFLLFVPVPITIFRHYRFESRRRG